MNINRYVLLLLFFHLLVFQLAEASTHPSGVKSLLWKHNRHYFQLGNKGKELASDDQASLQAARRLWEAFFFVDARFRQESIFQSGNSNRYRYRIRFRMGAKFPIHPKVNSAPRWRLGQPNVINSE